MNLRWLGAILIVAACGGTGFSLAAAHKKEERALQQILNALDYMESELQYKLTPLPELCRLAGKNADGVIGKVFIGLSQEMECQIVPDAAGCMYAALHKAPELPNISRSILLELGKTLGCFDLPGQLKGLNSCRNRCMLELEDLRRNRESRLRSYKILGLCTGFALAILLL